MRRELLNTALAVALAAAGLLAYGLAQPNPPRAFAQQGASTATTGAVQQSSFSIGNTSGSSQTSGANTVKVWAVQVPFQVGPVGHVAFKLTTGDGSNNSDVGVYGPCAAGTAACPLVVDIGAQKISSTSYAEYAVTTISLAPSANPYWFAFTSAAGTAAITEGSVSVLTQCGGGANSPTGSTGGALPASISVNVTCNAPKWSWNVAPSITLEP